MWFLRRLIYPFKWIAHHPLTFIVICVTQGIQITGVVLIAMHNNRMMECLLIYIGMVVSRIFWGGGFHAKSFFACTVTTWAIFYFLTSAVPPVYVTIFTSMCFGVGITIIMFHLEDYLKLLNRNKAEAVNDIEITKTNKKD